MQTDNTLPGILIDERNEEGLIAICQATGNLPTVAGKFSVGCLLVHTTLGNTYRNAGTTASPSWDNVDEGGGGGSPYASDTPIVLGDNSELKIEWSTGDADAFSGRVGLPNDLSGNNTGAVWFGSQADVIGTDIGIETGDSYVIGVFQKDRVAAIGMAAIDAVATIVGVGTKAFQMFNPASGVVFSIASDDTDTLITPESGTELALAGIVKATDGVRGKHSTANVTNPPTDAELDSAFGTPATVGAGFTATLDDAGGGTAMYVVASDGTNWWHTLMTKAE